MIPNCRGFSLGKSNSERDLITYQAETASPDSIDHVCPSGRITHVLRANGQRTAIGWLQSAQYCRAGVSPSE